MSKSNEPVLVKAPYQKLPFSEEQLTEFLKCADPVTGPRYFMENFFYIQHPTKGRMLYQPFEYQRRLIDTYHNYRFSISMLPRQTGKCVEGHTTYINIKNKHTGEIKSVSLSDFYEMQKNSKRSKQV